MSLAFNALRMLVEWIDESSKAAASAFASSPSSVSRRWLTAQPTGFRWSSFAAASKSARLSFAMPFLLSFGVVTRVIDVSAYVIKPMKPIQEVRTRRRVMAEEQKHPELNEALIEEIDLTEIVSVVQRPGMTAEVDYGDTDPDVAISLLVKGLFQLVMDEICFDEDFDEDEEEEEEEEPGA
jgi:hypothetical protein